jgi:hypothetical protein
MNTLSDLRSLLGETMRKVMDGTMSVEQAKAVAMVAGEVNATARLEVDMARATDGDFRGSGFIDVEPRIAPRPSLVGHR